MFCLKNVFTQGHILNIDEFEPEPLTDQFSNLYLCSATCKLHTVLLIALFFWYKVSLLTQMSTEELDPKLFYNIEHNT